MEVNERGASRRRLPCGVELASLIDQVADGTPPDDPDHQAQCPHCQATLAELEQVWDQVRELAREEVAAPDAIVHKAIRRIREALAALELHLPLEEVVPRLVQHALLRSERGRTRIAASVVAEIAARAARSIPSVHAVVTGGPLSTVRERAPGALFGVGVEVNGHRVAVRLHLVLEYGPSIPAVTSEVREVIVRRVEALTGLEIVGVDINVDDLYVPGE
jgi:uncharacterized alkaline shock family protein YloU